MMIKIGHCGLMTALALTMACSNGFTGDGGTFKGGRNSDKGKGGPGNQPGLQNGTATDAQGNPINIGQGGGNYGNGLNGGVNGSGGYQTVTKLGIHFEDFTDADYNDLSVCFEGSFAVNVQTRDVRSLAQQNVTITVKRISARNHTFQVDRRNSAGQVADTRSEPLAMNQTVSFTWGFANGDTVFVKTTESVPNGPTHIYEMTSQSNAQIELNTCRNTGT